MSLISLQKQKIMQATGRWMEEDPIEEPKRRTGGELATAVRTLLKPSSLNSSRFLLAAHKMAIDEWKWWLALTRTEMQWIRNQEPPCIYPMFCCLYVLDLLTSFYTWFTLRSSKVTAKNYNQSRPNKKLMFPFTDTICKYFVPYRGVYFWICMKWQHTVLLLRGHYMLEGVQRLLKGIGPICMINAKLQGHLSTF